MPLRRFRRLATTGTNGGVIATTGGMMRKPASAGANGVMAALMLSLPTLVSKTAAAVLGLEARFEDGWQMQKHSMG
jgi:hypothetical protein